MNRLIETINAAAAAWAPTMLAIIWQSTLLAALVAAACWALRRQSPRVRYWLWLLLAGKLLVLPLWTVNMPWPQRPFAVPPPPPGHDAASVVPAQPTGPVVHEAASFVPPAAASQAEPAPPPASTFSWLSYLLLLWLAVVAAEIARTAWQFRRLRRLLANSEQAPPEVLEIVAECARLLDLNAAPASRQIDGEGSPLVCGLIRPVLVLPTATLTNFDAAALRQIILHELAHVRRRDLWTTWIIHAMRMLYWFHPVAHWIAYRAGLERELACDELALQHSGATAGAYARTLIRAVGTASRPLALTAAAAARLDGGDRPRSCQLRPGGGGVDPIWNREEPGRTKLAASCTELE